MYIDDTKIFATSEKEQETPIQTIRIYTQDIGMEFAIGKCALLIIEKGILETTKGIELPNQESIGTFEEKENNNTLEYWKGTQSNRNE